MDSDGIPAFLRQNLFIIILAIVGLALLCLGIFQVLSSSQKDTTLEFESAVSEAPSKVFVDIEGAVIKPGVYELTSDKRIVDALALAGGLSEEADRDYVSKNVNLAGKISDGLKIYIPRNGEQILSADSLGSSSTMNINRASSADLESLPGVGPATATKIIEGRPYSSIGELLERKIVGNKVFDQIKDQISAN